MYNIIYYNLIIVPFASFLSSWHSPLLHSRRCGGHGAVSIAEPGGAAEDARRSHCGPHASLLAGTAGAGGQPNSVARATIEYK